MTLSLHHVIGITISKIAETFLLQGICLIDILIPVAYEVLQMNRFICSKSHLRHSVKLTCILPGDLAKKMQGEYYELKNS